MKIQISLIMLLTVSMAGFSQSPPLKDLGRSITARPDLEIRWKAAVNSYPSDVHVYHLLPNRFSPEIISNLTMLCSFTDKDILESSINGMVFASSNGERRLEISFSSGRIDYDVKEHFGPTNVVAFVPSKRQAINLTRKILPKLGIGLADIARKGNGGTPEFNVGDSEIAFFVKPKTVKYVSWRGVGFRRAVEGMTFLSIDTGGNGNIRFGDRSKIVRLQLSWVDLKRGESYPTPAPETLMQWVKQGKAARAEIYQDGGEQTLDWTTVKSVTIKKANIYYLAEPTADGQLLSQPGSIIPFIRLFTTITTDSAKFDLAINCPIIDETKP